MVKVAVPRRRSKAIVLHIARLGRRQRPRKLVISSLGRSVLC